VVHALLSKGADVNAKSDQGETALDAAKEKAHTDIASALMKAGARQ
jgi:ankyrin repeat protein